MKSWKQRWILLFSLPLLLLVTVASVCGLLSPELYEAEKPSWYIQSVGQDVVDLFLVVPFFGMATLYFYQGRKAAGKLWAGSLIYLVYTYVIYAFDVPFNPLFLVYCSVLGLSFYAVLLYAFDEAGRSSDEQQPTPSPFLVRITGIYFTVIAALFCLLWLSEIVPSISAGTTPESLKETGLFTNPIHVLDLSVVLPGILVTGLLLLRQNRAGYLLTPAILTFFILMDLTIAALSAMMYVQKAGGNILVALVMMVLAIVSSLLLWRWTREE